MGWIGLLCTFHATLPLLDQVSHLYFGAGCLVPCTEALDSFRNWLGNCIFHYMLRTAVFTLTFTVLKKNSCYVVTLLPNHKMEESRRKGIRMIKKILINLDFVSAGFFSRKTCGKSCSPQGV